MIIVINNHLDTSGGHHPGPSIHECGLPVTTGQTQPNGFQVYDVGRYIFIEVNMFELQHFWPTVNDMPKILEVIVMVDVDDGNECSGNGTMVIGV